MDRQHICIITETYSPEINGVALTMRDLALNLVHLGYRVSVIRPESLRAGAAQTNGSDDAAKSLNAKTSFDSSLVAEVLVKAISIQRYPGLQLGAPSYRRVYDHLRSQSVDAVYVATEGPLGLAAMIAAKRMRLAVMSGFHTRFDEYFPNYGLGWLKTSCTRYLRWFHNLSARTLAATPELVLKLRLAGIPRAALAARGVDATRFNPEHRNEALRTRWGASESQPVVLYVGRVASEKNLGVLFEAASRYFSNYRAKLVIVGEGPLLSGFQAAHPDVHFTGPLKGHALSQAYASADIFAFPSSSETFGNVILEAMASGLASVAFDYAAARELLVHGVHGSTVTLGNTAEFHNALGFELARWLMGARVGIAARTHVENRSPSLFARAVASHFEQLIQSAESRYELRKNTRQMA